MRDTFPDNTCRHGGGGWRIGGGGLWIDGANDVANLDPLRDLVGIDGADSSSGYSPNIQNNAKLVSLAALRHLRGAFPGGLRVQSNPTLASMSGLEGITRVNKNGLGDWSLYISENAKLCVTDTDRTRLTSCAAGTTCSSASACDSGNCGGTSLAIAGNDRVYVQARLFEKYAHPPNLPPFHVKRHRLHHFVLVF